MRVIMYIINLSLCCVCFVIIWYVCVTTVFSFLNVYNKHIYKLFVLISVFATTQWFQKHTMTFVIITGEKILFEREYAELIKFTQIMYLLAAISTSVTYFGSDIYVYLFFHYIFFYYAPCFAVYIKYLLLCYSIFTAR